MRKAGKLSAVACAAALAGATVAGAGAGANAATVSDPIVTGLAGPLQFEVTGSSILVAQSFSGTLSRVAGNGTVTDLASFPGSDVGGVAQGKWGRTYFTTTGPDGALVRTRSKDGTVSTLADLGAYEKKKNPDARYSYGIRGLSDTCAASIPEELRGQLSPYKGLVDSHPYALAYTRHGLFVADAGANAILFVSFKGKHNVRTVAVLPPQPFRITHKVAKANNLPHCVVNRVAKFEAVPTDVELTREGLVVSTLPGGPEGPSFGARGSVYRIGWHGAKKIATGFLGATNVAVSPRGTIYVSQLFGDKVSSISTHRGHNGWGKRVYGSNGHKPRITTVAELTQPAGLEWANGKLYVSSNVFGPGQIATITN